jgi:hypothetical protein
MADVAILGEEANRCKGQKQTVRGSRGGLIESKGVNCCEAVDGCLQEEVAVVGGEAIIYTCE